MATPVAARTDSRRLWAGLLLYGLLIYFCLPAAVVPLDDDFGYLRSVVETLQHHRPWTNDWLEPWAASLSSLSVLAYGVTGNFYGATYGLLAVFAAASFGFGVLLVRARGAELSAAMLLTALGLTFPTVFWKTIQYTSMALYLPCLLGALWAALRRRWLIYFVAWGLACAARQSAIAWIMLPLGVAFQSAGRERTLPRTREFWSPVIVALGGALLFLASRRA